MREAATKHGVYVCGGLIEREGGGAQPQVGAEPVLYNTIAAYGPSGDEVARYRKMHLSRVRVGPDATAEGDVLTPGEDLAFFDVAAGDASSGSGSGSGSGSDSSSGSGSGDGDSDGSLFGGLVGGGAEDSTPPSWRFGLGCCFDLRFKHLASSLTDGPPRNANTGLGANVLLYPSAWLASTGDLGHWDALLRARALDGQCYVLGTNQTREPSPPEGCTEFYGGTQVVGPLGEVVQRCDDDCKDGVVLADLSMDHLTDIWGRIPISTDGVSRGDLDAAVQRAQRAQQGR